MKKIIAVLSAILLLSLTSATAETSDAPAMRYSSGEIIIENSDALQTDCVLIAAQYSGAEITQIKAYDVKQPYENVLLYNDFDYNSTIKCMLWDSIGGMKPAADTLDVTLDVKPASMADMPSSGEGPSAMVVDEVTKQADTDGNICYRINGYIDGVDMSVTTNEFTTVGELTADVWSTENSKCFDAATVWNMTEGYKNISLDSVIKQGDIILYTDNGNLIAKFSSSEELIKYIQEDGAYALPVGDKRNQSQARVGYIFGKLEDIVTEDTTVLTIDGVNVQFEFGEKFIEVIEIDKNGNVSRDSGGTTIFDLTPFDEETKTGDMVYISTANNGQLNNVIVYRFL